MQISSILPVLGLFAATRSFPLEGQASAAPDRPTYSLTGTVVDEKQQPVGSAELTIARDGRTLAVLRTTDAGAFSFDTPGRGTIQVLTRRLGYKATTTSVELDDRPDTEVLRIVLEAVPTKVDAVVVKGTGGRLDLFYEHRRENAFGRFFDREEIEKSGVRLASDLFRTISGASLRPSRRYGNVIRIRGCQPVIWIDRVPIRDAELDEVATPDEIAGIEIYSSSVVAPPEFVDRDSRGCGAIVVWTRIN